MPKSTMDKVVDAVIASSAHSFTLEIQGGEPLLAVEGVKYLVAKAQRGAQAAKKEMSIVICTNLSLADEAFFAYCKDNEIAVSTSLDGPPDLHNACRELPGGNSHMLVRDKLTQAISKLGVDRVSALMTTTRHSLRHAKRIVDEYISLGLTHIFLRKLNVYGFARSADVEMYSPQEFLSFYTECLSHIIQRNREGKHLVEVYTSILLRKILTPYSTGFVDLLSPPGMGISFMAYDYNGNVYPSDECRMLSAMGDETFLLGNLLVDGIDAIVSAPHLKDIHFRSMAEGVPGCVDCVFLPYCGSDPVHHYNTQQDIVGIKPSSTFCHINKSIFRFLFEKVLHNDPDEMKVFWSWIRHMPIADVEGALPGHD
jgi:His-Xaa-Ser system radical SAM maturase HxsB